MADHLEDPNPSVPPPDRTDGLPHPDEWSFWGLSEEPAAPPPESSVPLYALDDVRAAAGLVSGLDNQSFAYANDTEHQTRLVALLSLGEKGRWRDAGGPPLGAEAAVAALIERAPHFSELSELLQINIRAARTIGLPLFLNPVVLVGEPGIGKTWLLSKLSELLGLPFRSYSMAISTLGEGLQGAHPSWRNAEPGLVAKTLLREPLINPILFIDEFDKVSYGSWNSDPYRPFYSLLDPSGSKAFVDEYLGFPINASQILWIMAANDLSGVPGPILDRLTVLRIPEPTFGQRISIVQSIYAEANAAHRSYFEPTLGQPAVEVLLKLNPRSMRLALQTAMARAASEARRSIRPDDIRSREPRIQWRAGFYHSGDGK